jgi:hypothetical protein
VKALRDLLPPAIGYEALLALPIGAGAAAIFRFLLDMDVISVNQDAAGSPPAMIGHCITAMVLVLLTADARRAMAWRRAAANFQAGDRSWVDRAVALCRQESNTPPDRQLLDEELGGLVLLLRRGLDRRIAVKYYPLVWLPLILGMAASAWPLDPAHVVNRSWLGVFWPFLVGAGETLLVTWLSYLLSSAWDTVLANFVEVAEGRAGSTGKSGATGSTGSPQGEPTKADQDRKLSDETQPPGKGLEGTIPHNPLPSPRSSFRGTPSQTPDPAATKPVRDPA